MILQRKALVSVGSGNLLTVSDFFFFFLFLTVSDHALFTQQDILREDNHLPSSLP